MDRPRRNAAKRPNTNSLETNGEKKKKEIGTVKKPIKKVVSKASDSDSESSSDDFLCVKSEPGTLKPKKEVKAELDFCAIESSIFDGVTRLSDSDSASDFEEVGNDAPVLVKVEKEPAKVNPIAESENDAPMLIKEEKKPAKADPITESKVTPGKKLKLSNLQRSAVNGLKDVKIEDVLKNEKEDGNDKKLTAKQLKASKNKINGIMTCESKKVQAASVVNPSTSQKKTKPSTVRNSRKTAAVVDSKPDRSSSKKLQNTEKSEKDQKLKADTSKSQKPQSGKDSDNKTLKSSKLKTQKAESKVKASTGSSKADLDIPDSKIPEDIDNLDMNELLALGENLYGKSISQVGRSPELESSDGEDDWEEVNTDGNRDNQHVVPKEGVQITLEMPELYRRRNKKKEDMQAVLNRQLNRVRREFQVLFHKVSVLCWLAHGFYINEILNNESLLAVALSLVPSNVCVAPAKIDLKYVQQILAWFVKLVDYTEGFTHIADDHKQPIEIHALERQFARRVAKSKRDLVFMFISVLRAVGVDARLVISLQPMPLKPQSSELFAINTSSKKSTHKKGRPSLAEEKSGKETKKTKSEPKPSTSKTGPKSVPKPAQKRKAQQPPAGSPSPRKTRSGAVRRSYKEESADSETDDKALSKEEDIDVRKKIKEPLLSPKRKSLSEDDKETLRKAAEKRIPSIRRRAAVSKKKEEDTDFDPKKSKSDSDEDDDSDFTLESLKKLRAKEVTPKKEVKKETRDRKSTPSSSSKMPGKGRKVLSSSEEEFTMKPKKIGMDYWVEVYTHKNESWVPVDVTRGKVDCADEIKTRATQPITYVIAWNGNNTLKDVTRRYVPQFAQVTAKQRVEEKWWEKTIKAYKPRSTAMEREEDGQLHMAQLNRPMPKSVAECKNHPLYVLKRHLLKFEAIYPADAPTLGFVKGEPLYARQNVYTLHSREIWLKEAKVVRMGEKPYKIVKARPKYDRMSGTVISDLPLEVFGSWQVEDYDPPTAVDGKVPRNAYGNVELFKPTMLPKGCVHLQLPSLNRVAKKLQIDCAPAVVGFDYHCGGSHPTYDGFVVCEESVDVLIDAWNKEMEEAEKRQKERDEKRIYGNWKRLIKGLIIREHLNLRYDFKDDDVDEDADPVDSRRNEIAAAEARLHQATTELHSAFPKLMANVRNNRRRKSTNASTSTKVRSIGRPSTSAGTKSVPKNTQNKTVAGRRRRRKDSTSEEEESLSSSSSEDEEEEKMVLLSDEDSGSEFDEDKDDDDDDFE